MISEIEAEFKTTREKVLKSRNAIRKQFKLLEEELKEFRDFHQQEMEGWSDDYRKLLKSIQKRNPLGRIQKIQKHQYYPSLSEFEKYMDRKFPSADTFKSPFSQEIKSEKLNPIICEYLKETGFVEQSESIQDEANLEMNQESRESDDKYEQLSNIVKEIYKQKLNLADQWIEQHQGQLEEFGIDLKFKAKVMRAINFINEQKATECITYIKMEMAADRKTPEHWKVIKQLLCSLIFIENLRDSPYESFASQTHWVTFASDFCQAFNRVENLGQLNPFRKIFKCGHDVTPKLFELKEQFKDAHESMFSEKELPFELNLGEDNDFHSIFICPVSKEIATKDNPPMVLVCGHVISQHSMNTLANNSRERRFKCPYCPETQKLDQAKILKIFE